jgi:mannobiose 2-epimerase
VELEKLLKPNRTKFLVLPSILLLLAAFACTPPAQEAAEDRRIREEIMKSLREELLDAWYPIALDTVHGGFLSDFTYDWRPSGRQNKMIVTQTRHVWTASQAAVFLRDDRYHGIAQHGFRFLKDKMWDETYGGFHWLRNREGETIAGGNGEAKTAYGNAFAIYALASYYAMSGDTSALHLAQKTFLWLDQHSRDPEYRGYLDRMTREGVWLSQSNTGVTARELLTAGWKDQNSSIHLLEAFAELYEVWPDSLLRERLLEMLVLIRDTITNKKGYLTLFMQRDWTPVTFRDSSAVVRERNYFFDHVSFGHDVETAFLMLEASHVLGLEADDKTLRAAQRMVDHALANGWDNDKGGFFYQGYYFGNADTISIINEIKEWWVQAEGLNALLLMAKLFPQEKKYEEAFKKQWEYMKRYLIDHEHGGWYKEGLDQSPEQLQGAKGSDWKVNYHESRALMNCIKMLDGEHELIKKHSLK